MQAAQSSIPERAEERRTGRATRILTIQEQWDGEVSRCCVCFEFPGLVECLPAASWASVLLEVGRTRGWVGIGLLEVGGRIREAERRGRWLVSCSSFP